MAIERTKISDNTKETGKSDFIQPSQIQFSTQLYKDTKEMGLLRIIIRNANTISRFLILIFRVHVLSYVPAIQLCHKFSYGTIPLQFLVCPQDIQVLYK